MSLARFYGAVQAATMKLTADAAPGNDAVGLAPVVDGVVLPAHPFDPGASAISANVPMLIGSNENEGVNGVDEAPELLSMTEAQVLERIGRYRGAARPIFEAYRREYPDPLEPAGRGTVRTRSASRRKRRWAVLLRISTCSVADARARWPARHIP